MSMYAILGATLIDGTGASPVPDTALLIEAGRIVAIGASDVPAEATPIGHRDAPCMIGIEANWDDPAANRANIAWARETAAALAPYSSGGGYLNFDDLSDPDAVRAAHGPNVARLAEVKRRYDPSNLFRSRGLPG